VAVVAVRPVALPQEAEVAVVALLVLLPVLLQVAAELLALLAHKRLPLLPQVAVVRPVALPQEAEAEVVVAVVLVQGLVASEILRSRWLFSASAARNSPSAVEPMYELAVSSR